MTDQMMSVTPTEHLMTLRRIKPSRTPERMVMSLRRWHERWLARNPDVAFSNPRFEWEYDPSRRRREAYFWWDGAVLPAGYGHHMLVDQKPYRLAVTK